MYRNRAIRNWLGGLLVVAMFLSLLPIFVSSTPANAAGATTSLMITASGNGSISRNSDQATYSSGTVVNLTATADPGWTFVGWSGDLSGSRNPTDVTMDGNKAITATFAIIQKVNTVTLAFSSVNPSVYGQRVTLVAWVLYPAHGGSVCPEVG